MSATLLRLGVREVGEAVAALHGLTWEILVSRTRRMRIVRPRWTAIWIARRYTGKSLSRIGTIFELDHTSVLHAVRRVDRRLAADPAAAEDMRRTYREVLSLIGAKRKSQMACKKVNIYAKAPRKAAQAEAVSQATTIAAGSKTAAQGASKCVCGPSRSKTSAQLPRDALSQDAAVRAATEKLIELLRQHHPEKEVLR